MFQLSLAHVPRFVCQAVLAEDFGGDECLYPFQVDRLILSSSLDVIREFSDRSNRISMLFKSTDTYVDKHEMRVNYNIYSAKLSCKDKFSSV